MEVVVGDLIIEVTRRCNIRCAHCLRGDSINLDIDMGYVSRLFDKVDRIYCLSLTGGEPSLVPHIISEIFSLAAQKGVSIGTFYIVTNAKDISDEFIRVLLDAYMYCDGDGDTGNCVDISCDIQHQDAMGYIPEENIRRLMALRFVSKRNEDHDYNGSPGTIWEGRAVKSSYTGRLPEVRKVYYELEYGELMIEQLYLNCLGNILSDCDLSYEHQDNNPDIVICNVMRKFSLLNSIKRHNRRLEHIDLIDINVA